MRCPRCRRWVDIADIDYKLDFTDAPERSGRPSCVRRVPQRLGQLSEAGDAQPIGVGDSLDYARSAAMGRSADGCRSVGPGCPDPECASDGAAGAIDFPALLSLGGHRRDRRQARLRLRRERAAAHASGWSTSAPPVPQAGDGEPVGAGDFSGPLSLLIFSRSFYRRGRLCRLRRGCPRLLRSSLRCPRCRLWRRACLSRLLRRGRLCLRSR